MRSPFKTGDVLIVSPRCQMTRARDELSAVLRTHRQKVKSASWNGPPTPNGMRAYWVPQKDRWPAKSTCVEQRSATAFAHRCIAPHCAQDCAGEANVGAGEPICSTRHCFVLLMRIADLYRAFLVRTGRVDCFYRAGRC